MRSHVVVVANMLFDDPSQMALVPSKDVVKTLAAYTALKALALSFSLTVACWKAVETASAEAPAGGQLADAGRHHDYHAGGVAIRYTQVGRARSNSGGLVMDLPTAIPRTVQPTILANIHQPARPTCCRRCSHWPVPKPRPNRPKVKPRWDLHGSAAEARQLLPE